MDKDSSPVDQFLVRYKSSLIFSVIGFVLLVGGIDPIWDTPQNIY